jgi:hypothetical protein
LKIQLFLRFLAFLPAPAGFRLSGRFGDLSTDTERKSSIKDVFLVYQGGFNRLSRWFGVVYQGGENSSIREANIPQRLERRTVQKI